MGTMDTLIEHLMRKPRDGLRDQLVANASAGLYHDFKSPHPTPKMLLVADLRKYGYRDLARRAERGEYDDRADAEDDSAMARMMAEDPALAAKWEKVKDQDDPEAVFAILAEGLDPEERARARAEMGVDFFTRTRRR